MQGKNEDAKQIGTKLNSFVNQESAEINTILAPYIVSFGFLAHDQIPPRPCTGSCFFLIINGHWVMCTAAHVIDDINHLISSGITVSDWHIHDGFTQKDRQFAYPFDIMKRDQFRVRDDELGFDYCLILVESLAAESMASSGVRAIGKVSIGLAEEADRWVLTGFPASFTNKMGKSINQRHYVLGVTKIDRPHDWDLSTNKLSLFGKLDTPLGEDSIDIGGMSGGPIFGLFGLGSGKPQIRLVAIQSGWSARTRIITICPISPFLDAIDNLILDEPTFCVKT